MVIWRSVESKMESLMSSRGLCQAMMQAVKALHLGDMPGPELVDIPQMITSRTRRGLLGLLTS